jgi:Protein of unknown function (DUF2786)
MERENIIDKVRKLRALADNAAATVDEAASAARAAELLIQKHALAEAELGSASQGVMEGIINDDNPLTDWDQRQTRWQNVLLHALAENYNCSNVLKRKDGKLNIFTIGRPSDIEVMRYQFAYFVLELTRLAQMLAPRTLQRGTGKTWHNSFYHGAVNAIIDSLKSARTEVTKQATSNAIIFINNHMLQVEALKNKLYPDSRTVYTKTHIDRDAYEMGQQAGAGLQAKPALAPGVRGLLK